MELRPGTYFEMGDKPYEFVGVAKDPADETRQKLVLKTDPDRKGEALHTMVDPAQVENQGRNFWTYGPEFSMAELRGQYESQIQLLFDAGILSKDGQGGFITGVDGKRYPPPSFDAMRRELTRRQPELKEKIEQGFDRLLLVPFGMDVRTLADKCGEFMVRKNEEYIAKNPHITLPGFHSDLLNTHMPIKFVKQMGELGTITTLLYDPVVFGERNMAKTKQQKLKELASSAFPGWQVVLISKTGVTGTVEARGRKNMEHRGKNPDTCLKLLHEDEIYKGEEGMYIEDYLTRLITEVQLAGMIRISDFMPSEYMMGNLVRFRYEPEGKIAQALKQYRYTHQHVPNVNYFDKSIRIYMEYESDSTAGTEFQTVVRV